MVKHIVTFKFKGNRESRLETAESFRNDLLTLPGIIDELISIEVGINENPDEKWDLVLTATANSFKDVKIYSGHEAHMQAVAKVKQQIEERACVDYSIF